MASHEIFASVVCCPTKQVKINLDPFAKEQPVPAIEKVPIGGDHAPLPVPASRNNSLGSEDPFCRICHEGNAAEVLLSPCECAGSLAMVHRSCVEHWLTASNTSRCELCHFEFALERLPKPLSEWLRTPSMQHQRRTLCGDAICFMFITPLASLSGWLCVQGAVDLYYSNGMEAVGLIALTSALFTIYLLWTLVSLRYHIHLFETWKQKNQQVRLLIPRPAGMPNHQDVPAPNLQSKCTSKESMV